MHKALVIFLLVLLPVQFVWGAAAVYCQHEQGNEVSHFGHHLHKHQGKVTKSVDGSSDKTKLVSGEDVDCVSCHLSCAPVVSDVRLRVLADEMTQAAPAAQRAHSWLLVEAIDRPKWTDLS